MHKTHHDSNIYDVKTHLSQPSQYAERSEKVGGKPVVQQAQIDAAVKPKRIMGTLRGQIKIADDFDEMPDWFMDYFR